MALNPIVDSRDVRFVLFEMLKIQELSSHQRFADFDQDTYDEVLTLAENIAVEKVYPANREGDRNPVTYDPSTKSVTIPAAYFAGLDAYYEAGFLGLPIPQEEGGMGMPAAIYQGVSEYFTAASAAFSMYPALSIGAMNLIIHFYEHEDKALVVEKMMTGEWGGTMCLTEPEAGSDVGALVTKAKKDDQGTYSISGNKIWISSGENNYYKNMIHPVLARLEGDPKGTKGISIFMVPKFHFDALGKIQGTNDVICTGIEHKMGIHGSATTMLAFGDEGKCHGRLIGEAQKGMKIMFKMMNEARLYVGLQGAAVSSAAYMHAVAYAKTRLQGVHVTQMLNADAPKVAIIEHPDVKRMLLDMKAKVEAMRALVYYCGYLHDLVSVSAGAEAKKAQGLLDFLIPIAKAGNTDLSWEVTGQAIQVYGGYGYTADYPVEQFARDAKIQSLYEGTNGIQAMDLAMRKLLMNENQENYRYYREEADRVVAMARGIVQDQYINAVEQGLKKMDAVIEYLKGKMAEGKFLQIFAEAVHLQRALSMLSYAWLHLWSLSLALPKMKALTENKKGTELDAFLAENREAAFYSGRVLSAQFYLGSEFAVFQGACDRILNGESAVMKVNANTFSGSLNG